MLWSSILNQETLLYPRHRTSMYVIFRTADMLFEPERNSRIFRLRILSCGN